jgi:hypothetical protein
MSHVFDPCPNRAQHSASWVVVHMPEALPSLILLHQSSPHATATLRHHGLKWLKLNISNISKEKSVGLRPNEYQGHGTGPPQPIHFSPNT